VPCRDADSPAWSPDGTKIAFNRIDNIDGHNPGSKIQTIDVATGEITTIVATEGAEYAGGQRWSPDGHSLVIEIVRLIDDGNNTAEITGKTIAVVNMTAATATLSLLRPFDSYSTYPDWHPTQADLILFASGPPDPLDPMLPPQNLFTTRPDGTGLTQITHQGPSDDGLWMPAFRFDSDGILATLVHRPNGNLTLAELQADGSEVSQLGDLGEIPGAHARQRPTPAVP
jgi:Tol biopolymer transport system component